MSNLPVTANDIAQALSRNMIDITVGRDIKKSKLEKQIAISDALNRRLQTKVNLMRVMIDAKRAGIDFTAAMREVSTLVQETGNDMGDLRAVEE